MANALVDLTTLEAAKAHLTSAGVTPPADPVLEQIITEVSAQIGGHISRCLRLQPHSQRFSGHGGCTIMVPHFPIVSVQAVRISGVNVRAATGDGDFGFVFDDKLISIRGGEFERGVHNCTVEYTAGYSTIPADIQRACNEAIRSGLESLGADAGGRAIKYKAGDTEIALGDLRSLAELCFTPTVHSALKGWERVAPC